MITQWIKNKIRKKKQVFIIPTRMGGYLNGLIFLMFLLSVGYSSNLLLIFTLLLFSFNLMWVIQTHSSLKNLIVKFIDLTHAHAAESFDVTLVWNRAPESGDWEISLENDLETIDLDIKNSQDTQTFGHGVLKKRGLYHWSYLKVATSIPFGLYRIWTYIPINTSHYIYPELLKIQPQISIQEGHKEGSINTGRIGTEEIFDLVTYNNHEVRKISWKHYARQNNLVVKVGEEQIQSIHKINLQCLPDGNKKEYELSLKATEMYYCHNNQIPFYLKTEHKQFGPESHLGHLHQCLKELSIC